MAYLMFAEPSGSSWKKEFEIFNFTCDGGVALAMYNTDEVDINERGRDIFFLIASFTSLREEIVDMMVFLFFNC